jgi:hypothetical protein
MLTKSQSSAASIGTTPRKTDKHFIKDPSHPGPSNYSQRELFGLNGKGSTMGIMLNQKISLTPGPACYNSAKPLGKGSAQHFALSKRPEILNLNPGPSDYNTSSSK